MYNIRTDMAYEAHKTACAKSGGKIDGVIFTEYPHPTIYASKIEILNELGERETGKPQGTYITAKMSEEFAPSDLKVYSAFISERIKELLPSNCTTILIAGLGNRFITADSVGPKAVSHIIVTRHINSICPTVCKNLSLGDVAALAPGVLAQTGIESGEIIRSVIRNIKPSCLIAIDALATQSFSHLYYVVQLSDSGIRPGSGVYNSRFALTKETMGIPVISIGVPTVIDASGLATDISKRIESDTSSNQFADNPECFITLKESDIITDNMAKLIAYSLNLALHKNMSFEEMLSLCS